MFSNTGTVEVLAQNQMVMAQALLTVIVEPLFYFCLFIPFAGHGSARANMPSKKA